MCLLIALLRCALIFWLNLNLEIGSKTVRFVAYIVSEYNLYTCWIFGGQALLFYASYICDVLLKVLIFIEKQSLVISVNFVSCVFGQGLGK